MCRQDVHRQMWARLAAGFNLRSSISTTAPDEGLSKIVIDVVMVQFVDARPWPGKSAHKICAECMFFST